MDDISQKIINKISSQILGKEAPIKLALCCLLAKGHLLIEDLPGMGKTTLSHALSAVVGLSFSRVQFTSDLLPADIIGVSIFKADTHEFSFHPGPIFNQVILADEINRASPKTQSALLEAMAESQVSVDGKTHSLPSPFFVIATQNPLHQSGTYPLPESQLDRFLMRISIGYPPHSAELDMLKQTQSPSINEADFACIDTQQLQNLQQQVTQIHASDELLNYILKLVNLSRQSSEFPLALSPRASQSILQAAKAWAFIEGRQFVTADDVQAIFPTVTEHRLAPAATHLGAYNQSELSYSHQLLSAINPV